MAIRRKPDHSEPPCRLVRFETADGIDLAGALFEPKRATTRAAVFVHGTGGASVFEARRTNLLAREFLARGIAWFPFNNRGAQLVRRAGDKLGGMAYERIRDGVHDIDGALRELRRRGYRDLTLIGHSTGANKIALYDHYTRRNFAKRYVFAGGGDDTGLAYEQLGPRKFAAMLGKARTMIRERRGDELVSVPIAPAPMSWRSFYDTANPNGDYNVFPFLEAMRGVRLSRRPRFRHLRGIRKPSLFLYGDRDEYCYGDVSGCVAALADALGPKPNIELAIVRDADHGFRGREHDFARVIIDWIEAT